MRSRLIAALISIAIAVLITVCFLWVASEGESAEPQLYQGVPIDAQQLEINKKALDEAYHQQVLFLFGVWLKGGEADDGRRFANGMRILRRAHALAAAQIEKREEQIKKGGSK